jgi:hypothetical protein
MATTDLEKDLEKIDVQKQREARFETTTEEAIDGNTLGPASTNYTDKSSTGYANSVLGEDHKNELHKSERKLLLKLGEFQGGPRRVSSARLSCPAHFHVLFSFSDVLILPLASLLYLSAYLDRGNLGNARLQGLESTVLKGSDANYSLALACFYIRWEQTSITCQTALRSY